MAKKKNGTNKNQIRKQHRTGIKREKMPAFEDMPCLTLKTQMANRKRREEEARLAKI